MLDSGAYGPGKVSTKLVLLLTHVSDGCQAAKQWPEPGCLLRAELKPGDLASLSGDCHVGEEWLKVEGSVCLENPPPPHEAVAALDPVDGSVNLTLYLRATNDFWRPVGRFEAQRGTKLDVKMTE